MRVQKLAVVYLLGCVAVYSAGRPAPHMGRGFGAGREMGMHSGKVVPGAPYTADVSNSVVQTLPDGNVIQHSTSGKVARDVAGRTYSQETFSGGPFGRKVRKP